MNANASADSERTTRRQCARVAIAFFGTDSPVVTEASAWWTTFTASESEVPGGVTVVGRNLVFSSR